MTRHVLILNGPNLNLLGERQPEFYGRATLEGIYETCRKRAKEHDLEVDFRQSNSEGEMIDWLHEVRDSHAGAVINAGAYTHTSIALMDAISSVKLPVVEVHLSNIHARERFRRRSYVSQAAIGQICGFGAAGYAMALEALAIHLDNS